MKALLQYTLLLVVLVFLTVSCSDDPVSSSDRGNQIPDSVPTGEIVPVEERNFVLTGFDELSPKLNAKNDSGQKWWLQIVSKVEYEGCPSDFRDEEIRLNNTYFSFGTDGRMYRRTGTSGSGTNMWPWQWKDDRKNAVHIQGRTDIDFILTALNDNQVVYASVQNLGEGCRAVTWEQFGSPVTD